MLPNYERGFLATGPQPVTLPYEAIAPVFQRAIRDAINAAWKSVLTRIANGSCVASGEVPITIELEDALNDLLEENPSSVPGFSAETFETVIRGAELVSYDGKHIQKRPDLTFRLRGRRLGGIHRIHHGLFVECKFIDDRASLRAYCDDGIMRYVRGDYAWAMNHSMMIGYVATNDRCTLEFRDYLVNDRQKYLVEGDVNVQDDVTLSSKHSRPWQYPTTKTDPGAIEVVHFWLPLNSGTRPVPCEVT